MSTNPSSERPPYIEQLRAESRGLPYKPTKRKNRNERLRPSREDAHRLFTMEKGNRWLELARREPEAKTLFGELWHQGELCMMFADTNIGKSILAVQIGESIARGQTIAPFACQAPPARVLYIDFELSKTQFGLRYSKGQEDHLFSDNFFRAQYNFMPDPPPNVDENELLIAGIEYKVLMNKATVLIIDNITCLRGGTENSAVALALMKSLKALKTDHDLSILVLAHTPKRRNATQPLSADDLHGSKLLVNFADSAFAIGKSTANADLCYLKQIKQRNARQRYGNDNVCLCRIQKPGAFLHFTFEGYSAEHHHLLSRTAATRQEFTNKIATLSAAGHSQRDISKQLGLSLATVNRLIRCVVPIAIGLQMCECADEEERCADTRMRGCADEEASAPCDSLPGEGWEGSPETKILHEPQICEEFTRAKPMTNDQPTNDKKGWEGSPETKILHEPQICEEFSRAKPMTNDQPTNDKKGWERFSEMKSPSEPQLRDCQIPEAIRALPPPNNDPMINDSMTIPPPITNDHRKTSAIDALLTPELLNHILQNTTPKNSIRKKENDNFSQLNTLTNTDANDGEP